MPVTTIAEAFEQARALDAPLAERLDTYAASVRELNKPMADAVDRLVSRLQDSTIAKGAPGEGEPMPPFLLPDHTGRLVGLEELTAQGPVAITFARGHWCPYCRIAVSALAAIVDEATAIGGRIVVIVPDRQAYAAKLRAEANAPLSILTDLDNGYALSLGLAFWVGEEMQQLHAGAQRRPLAIAGQRQLVRAGPGHLRRRPRRPHRRPPRRPRLSQAHGARRRARTP